MILERSRFACPAFTSSFSQTFGAAIPYCWTPKQHTTGRFPTQVGQARALGMRI